MTFIIVLVCIAAWLVTTFAAFGYGISVGKNEILSNNIPRLEARAKDADGYRYTLRALRAIADVESTDDAKTVARAALRQANSS